MHWEAGIIWLTNVTEEERLGLVHGDSNSRSGRSLPPYEEEDDDDQDYDASPSDDYAYDDDMKFVAEGKSERYGRGITDSASRDRAGSGSSSGNEKGLGISRRQAYEPSTPPKPPSHGGSYGQGSGGRRPPGSSGGPPHGSDGAFI